MFIFQEFLTYLSSKHISFLYPSKTEGESDVDCGSNDYLFAWPIMETRKLHEKLLDLGINHVYKEFIGDHTCCVMNSTGDALEVFSKAMAFEMLTGVEPKGKLATTWGEIKREK